MARKDPRALRDEAQTAASAGKHKRALECYVELERVEAGDPQWPKRAGDMLRRLGKDREAIAAYDRAVDRYAQSGFVVQAIAMCRLILQIDPTHSETARRLADMTEQQESGRTRIGALAAAQAQVTDEDLVVAKARKGRASTPAPAPAPVAPAPKAPIVPPVAGVFDLELEPAPSPRAVIEELSLEPEPDSADIPIERGATITRPRRTSEIELAPDDLMSVQPSARVPAARIAAPRPAPTPPPAPAPPPRRRPTTPISLAPGAPLDTVRLGRIAPGALERKLPDGSLTGIVVIPLDDEVIDLDIDPDADVDAAPDDHAELSLDDVAELDDVADFDPATDPEPTLESDPAEADEVGPPAEPAELASPRAWSHAARRALAATPLLSGLGHDALEDMMTRIGLVSLEAEQVLFREGDPGDTLYIIAEGEVGVAHEGPPRRPIARLGPGAFFGEVALVTEQPRTATVEAITPALLLAIDRALVSHLVASHPDVLFVILRFVRDRLLARLMETSPMFAPMAPADRGSLAARFRFLEIDPGTVIVDEGKRADGLYVFLAGRADARRAGALVRYLGAGDLAGETSVLHAEPSPVRIAAITRCLALCLGGADFREIIMTHPHVLEYVGELADAQRRGVTSAGDFHLDLI